MILGPLAVNKSDKESNIDYIYKHDGGAKDNAFVGNVFYDLRLRGLSGTVINQMSLEERVEILRQKLELRETIQTYRGAISILEDSSLERMLDPGQFVPCILHHNNHTLEKC